MNDNFELRPPQIVTPEGVAVDNTVTASQRQTVHIRPPGTAGGKQFGDYPFTAALKEVAS